MKEIIRRYAIAIRLLTVFPVGLYGEVAVLDRARSVVFFPLVGLVMGGVLSIVHTLAKQILPEDLADLLTIILLMAISGGKRQYGIGELLRSRNPGMYLARQGSAPCINAETVFMLIALPLAKFYALNQISSDYKGLVLLLLPMVSSWSLVVTGCLSNYWKGVLLGADCCMRWVWGRELLLATVLPLAVMVLFLKLKAFAVLLIMALFPLIFLDFCRRYIPAFDEKVLIGSNELSDIIFLVCLRVMNIW